MRDLEKPIPPLTMTAKCIHGAFHYLAPYKPAGEMGMSVSIKKRQMGILLCRESSEEIFMARASN